MKPLCKSSGLRVKVSRWLLIQVQNPTEQGKFKYHAACDNYDKSKFRTIVAEQYCKWDENDRCHRNQ